jgi:hypothetical protein
VEVEVLPDDVLLVAQEQGHDQLHEVIPSSSIGPRVRPYNGRP